MGAYSRGRLIESLRYVNHTQRYTAVFIKIRVRLIQMFFSFQPLLIMRGLIVKNELWHGVLLSRTYMHATTVFTLMNTQGAYQIFLPIWGMAFIWEGLLLERCVCFKHFVYDNLLQANYRFSNSFRTEIYTLWDPTGRLLERACKQVNTTGNSLWDRANWIGHGSPLNFNHSSIFPSEDIKRLESPDWMGIDTKRLIAESQGYLRSL